MEREWKAVGKEFPFFQRNEIVVNRGNTNTMHRTVVVRAFKKAKEEEMREYGIAPSLNRCALRLSCFISEEANPPFAYHQKSLYNLYSKAIKDIETDFYIKQPQVVHALCNYLGYENYEDFVCNNRRPKIPKDTCKKQFLYYMSKSVDIEIRIA